MNWLNSLFSSGSSQNSRKGQAMSSTHEAFSIPTHSPTFASHPDAFNPDTLNTPDPESANSSRSYTYPPQSPGPYGYIPTSAGSSSRTPSLLPMHHDPLHSPALSHTAYPPLASTWQRLRAWLAREYPELGDTLNYGILPQDLTQIEMQFGFALPAVIRQSYLLVDGQEAESAAGCSEGLFFGLVLLPLEDVLEEWRFWREVDDDPSTGANPRLREAMESIPPGWIRKDYSQRGWIPLIADRAGNYIGVDLNPGESGSVGQVIVFGRDFDTKVVLFNGDGAAGWAKWLASFVEDLESGEGYEIGAGSDGGDNSEDDLGYESYFYDGSGRGQGDGGGDSGSGGGLRLTGEYRGWNVLEAWADRSVRKWYEAGVISEILEPEDEKGKATENVGLGVLELNQGSAEVAIPVLVDSVSAPALGNVTNTGARKPPPNLPTISITKPPAPMPVSLPTPRDIVALPSPPDSNHSFDQDLESGRRGARSRDQSADFVSPPSSSRRPSPTNISHDNADASGSALASDAVTESLLDSTSPPQALSERMSPPPEIPDLLADSAPVMESTPVIKPTSPAGLRSELPTPSPIESPETAIPEPSKDLVLDEFEAPASTVEPSKDLASSDPVDTDVTIRLVGWGGASGIVDSPPVEEEQPRVDGEPDLPDTDAASINSVTSDSSVKKGTKHKKTKSGLAGLKKLGHLGGLRKKGSVGSVKDVIVDSTQ